MPREAQEFLDACGYQAKKTTLEVLARLCEESSSGKVAEAIETAAYKGAGDVDSVLAIFNALYRDIIGLDPLVLLADVPEIPPVKLDLSNYDN